MYIKGSINYCFPVQKLSNALLACVCACVIPKQGVTGDAITVMVLVVVKVKGKMLVFVAVTVTVVGGIVTGSVRVSVNVFGGSVTVDDTVLMLVDVMGGSVWVVVKGGIVVVSVMGGIVLVTITGEGVSVTKAVLVTVVLLVTVKTGDAEAEEKKTQLSISD